MNMTCEKIRKPRKISFKKVKHVVITEGLVKDSKQCYKYIKKVGIEEVIQSGVDAKLLFTFLIYFFEQREEYEKCAYLKKLYDSYLA